MKAVILAGGLGTRLHPYTFLIPKPMLPLGNKPLLEHIIQWLKESKKIDEIILSVSYLHKFIQNYFEDGARFGINIRYAVTEKPMGTAGQLKAAENLIMSDNSFVCLSSDHIYNFRLDDMILQHVNTTSFVTMALLPYTIVLDKDFINIQQNTGEKESNLYNITSWNKKNEIMGLINIGCYVFNHEFFSLIPKSSVFAMDTVFKKIMINSEKLIKGFIVNQEFIDIGDKPTYLDLLKKFSSLTIQL